MMRGPFFENDDKVWSPGSAGETENCQLTEPVLAMEEPYPPYDTVPPKTALLAHKLLIAAEADLSGPHTRMTAWRLAHYLTYWFRPQELSRFTTFSNVEPVIDQMIVISPIHYWACCSHHLLPFYGVVHFGYIPAKRLVGLSMVPLLVREFCARPWLQETMTQGLADLLEEELNPLGLGVITTGIHTCQMMDLGGPPVPELVFSEIRGLMRKNGPPRAEFLKLLGR